MKASLASKLDQLTTRRAELERLLSDPEATADLDRYRSLTREHAELGPLVESHAAYRAALADESAAADMQGDAEMKAFADEELASARARLAALDATLQRLLLPKDPDDAKPMFLEVRAGTGGDESALFAGDLLRMYLRYAERQRWQIEMISSSPAELGGYKEAIVRIGPGSAASDALAPYARLKFESGGHRVQRVPVTETQGRIHTSACTLAVMPEPDDIADVDIRPDEIRIDTFRASGAGGQHINKTDSAVRITHLPTGIVVECQDDRSQHKNKAQALKVLAARIKDRQVREQQASEAATRRTLVGSGDRSERIRTYNFPQGRVTDHRINLTLYKLELILDGDLDELMSATALPRHEVGRLAAFATGRERTSLIAHADRAFSASESATLSALVERRLAGEPLAYLIGRRDFYGRAFTVDRRVLIPRPETELVVDLALAHCDARASRTATVLDLGTGSGVIAITLALERPRLAVTAADVSPDALEVAATNARDLAATVRLVASDWYAAFHGNEPERFDLIVSNPPYIASDDRHLGEGDLRFEPRHALTGGNDGLDAVRRIVAGATMHLRPSGVLIVEHGHDQASAVRALCIDAGLVDIRSWRDLAGIERVVSATIADL